MSTGAFSEKDRAAIYEATGGRCAGCGRTDLNAQHRWARGKGGTTRRATPAHGVALCGSGTTGCHGWAEHHPTYALLLGWRTEGEPADEPFWTQHGWRRWVQEDDGCWLVEWVAEEELTDAANRLFAVAAYETARVSPKR